MDDARDAQGSCSRVMSTMTMRYPTLSEDGMIQRTVLCFADPATQRRLAREISRLLLRAAECGHATLELRDAVRLPPTVRESGARS